MTSLKTSKGPTPGTVVVKIADLEAWEQRWQETRDNQVQSMNNLLAVIEELKSKQGEDAATIAFLTGQVAAADERARQLEMELGEALNTEGEVPDSFLPEVTPTSGPADVTWERRIDPPDPVDEAVVAIEEGQTMVSGAMGYTTFNLPDGEERPASRLTTSDAESSGRHASLT